MTSELRIRGLNPDEAGVGLPVLIIGVKVLGLDGFPVLQMMPAVLEMRHVVDENTSTHWVQAIIQVFEPPRVVTEL